MRTTLTTVLLAMMFGLPIASTLRSHIYNPDLWCHLRTGDWILQQHALPETDPFGQDGAQRVFIAYSWLFEVAAAKLYLIFGLSFVPVATALLTAAIVLALFLLLRCFPISASSAAVLVLLLALSVSSLFYLRTWLVSILFFLLELWLLLRTDSNPKKIMVILPLMFAAWSNIHIQFIYGLFVLALFAAEAFLQRISPTSLDTGPPQWTLRNRVLLFVLCLLATLVNPYGIRIYLVFFEYLTQQGVLPYVRELRPFSPDSLIALLWLLIPGAAIWCVGYFRLRRPFLLGLLLWALYTGFHMVRDIWIVSLVSVLVVLASTAGLGRPKDHISLRAVLAACALVVILMFGLWRHRRITNERLAASLWENEPAGAAQFIEHSHLPGPLFNSYGWGGYLMWRLPSLPVSIDGRTNVYGPERIERQHQTINAAPGWDKDPSLRAARLILIAPDEPLTAVLRNHRCYRLAYSDEVSVLFTPRENCLPPDSLADEKH